MHVKVLEPLKISFVSKRTGTFKRKNDVTYWLWTFSFPIGRERLKTTESGKKYHSFYRTAYFLDIDKKQDFKEKEVLSDCEFWLRTFRTPINGKMVEKVYWYLQSFKRQNDEENISTETNEEIVW